jgi:hypothetical protein
MQPEPPQEGNRDQPTSTKRSPQLLSTILGTVALVVAIVALVVAVTLPRPVPNPTQQASAWANVSADGTLLGGFGIHSVSHEAVGAYLIEFSANVTAGCAQVATPSGYPPGDVLVDPWYGPSPGEDNLYTFSSTNGTPINSPFSLVVYC